MGSKITAEGDAAKNKRYSLLGRKARTKLDSKKTRDIHLPTKVHTAKATVFLVITYGYESWTTGKAECQRIDAFKLWCGEDS